MFFLILFLILFSDTDTVAIDLIIDLQIPAHVLLTNDVNYFRNLLRGLPLPYNINESVTVIDVDLTTGEN